MTLEMRSVPVFRLPRHALSVEKMPGHWLLARLGKRVLRPGGIAMTRWLIKSLKISKTDEIVELAPGLGVTARLMLETSPLSYIGVERDPDAARQVTNSLDASSATCVVGRAEETGLPSRCATIVLGEAILSMHADTQKHRIVGEACRLLKPFGRYAIHELCIRQDDLSSMEREAIDRDLSQAIHVGVKVRSATEWRELLAMHGLEVIAEKYAPMHLLGPSRILRDEGLFGFIRFLVNMMKDRSARRRVRQMRGVFRRHSKHLSAIGLVARKIVT